MGPTIFFLSSGLFLGWSLGANDASNIFGTAVASRMTRFSTAAIICSIFVIIGAVVSGGGAANTLGKLGAISHIAGAFTVALASAGTVFSMNKVGLPVSTSQAIVGGIIGWNFFAGFETDHVVVSKIVSTWILCPLLAAVFSVVIFLVVRFFIKRSKIHLVRLDSYTRTGLLVVGAFGSYSLGANNIANVMGVFVPSSPFSDVSVMGLFAFTSAQKLFLLGGVAIAVGVVTYSKKMMMTVGSGIYKLSPVAALVVVCSSSLVLFIFASKGLHTFMINLGLPAMPLVPVSSSQAVVGAVIGVSFARGGGRNINFGLLGKISIGWLATPVMSGILTYISLFFMQNVFLTKVV